ncbi:transmembrane prolyl 4-hydroxylase-like isoform X2 [Oculina patagonica]
MDRTTTNTEKELKRRRKMFVRPCFAEDEPNRLTCSHPEEDCDEETSDLRLVRLEASRIGHVRWMYLEEGRSYKVITRALKPLLFEIPDFLSDQECQQIISLAKEGGLSMSKAGHQSYEGDLDEVMEEGDRNATLDRKDHFARDFNIWDANKDGFIDLQEIKEFAQKHKALHLKKDEIHKMLQRSGKAGSLVKDKMTRRLFVEWNIKKLLLYMEFLKTKSPRHRSRYSQQAWLRQDKITHPVLKGIYERIAKLTKLPRKIIHGSEAMQVVHYEKYGHYHAHFDTGIEHTSIPCCHQNHAHLPLCKLCRFITILYYLNDVEEGGETAFPFAHNTTISREGLENMNADDFNLSTNCHSANLVFPAKKGTAIMWYNNFIDQDSGLLGTLDLQSLHGGCDVTKGEKWIANSWLTAPTKESRHIKSIYQA